MFENGKFTYKTASFYVNFFEKQNIYYNLLKVFSLFLPKVLTFQFESDKII